MMLLPFSKRRTMPVMSSPFLSLNSLKMRSRSSSRTRWMRTCLAVCAAMRPNASAPASASRRSPNSLSCSAARSSSSGARRSGSRAPRRARPRGPPCAPRSAISRSSSASSSSTTVMNWKRSTEPVSSLNVASSSRFGPNVLFAAVRIACSRALMSTLLSMLLSRPTCSRTMSSLASMTIPVPSSAACCFLGFDDGR